MAHILWDGGVGASAAELLRNPRKRSSANYNSANIALSASRKSRSGQ
jgi:hypothetical protein